MLYRWSLISHDRDKTDTTNATCKEFISRYRLPIFAAAASARCVICVLHSGAGHKSDLLFT